MEMEICAVLRKNECDPATVSTSKENRCLRAFGWNWNWLIRRECDCYISEKNILKKKAQSSPKTSSLGDTIIQK